ncbi:MAG: nuclear transport factor 2 family protein [Spirulina sp.]
MNQNFQNPIARAAEACRQKDAEAFAALFTLDGELELAGGQKISGRDAIARATADYFATCEEIRIDIQRIRTDGDRAVVEWVWYSVDKATGHPKRAENTIALHFQGEAIACWQEARR